MRSQQNLSHGLVGTGSEWTLESGLGLLLGDGRGAGTGTGRTQEKRQGGQGTQARRAKQARHRQTRLEWKERGKGGGCHDCTGRACSTCMVLIRGESWLLGKTLVDWHTGPYAPFQLGDRSQA